MPSFSYRSVVKKLKKLGFIFYRQAKGSHEFWIHSETKEIIMLAKHNEDFSTGAISDLAKKIGFKNLKEFEAF